MRALLLVLLLSAVARAGDARAPLARLAKATTPEAREAAGEELLAAGPAVEAELLAALPSLPPEAAAVALGVLGELATPGAPAALLRAAESPDVARRQAAADQLPRFAARPEVASVLVRLCRDADDDVALAAAGGLRAAAPQAAYAELVELVSLAEDEPRAPARVAAEALGRLLAAGATEERVERLLAAARMARPAPRRLLLEALTAAGPPAAPPLLALLEAAWGVELLDDEARARARDQLGELADPVPEETRELAVRGLARVARTDARAARAAARALRDPSLRVRGAGLRAHVVPLAAHAPLCAIPGAEGSDGGVARLEALALLLELLVDPDDGLRRAAHARLVLETGAALPLSHLEWSAWLARQRAASPPPAEEEP